MRRLLPVLICTAEALAAALVLDQPLQGSTTGTRLGGAFVTGGWQITNQYDAIYWHVSTTPHGAFEFDIKGLGSGCSGVGGGANELCDMYDWTFASADTSYIPGFRDNPYKMLALKRCEGVQNDRLKTVWKIGDNFVEPNSQVLAWNATTTYHFRFEWSPDGNGNTFINSYRDGLLYLSQSVPGAWTPTGQSVRIGASTRRQDEGAPVGATYSNVKVWNLDELPPIIAQVSPDPDVALINLEYTRQLTLLQGAPPITWSVILGPPGTQVDVNGLVDGWSPVPVNNESFFTFSIRASNPGGNYTESWQVRVRSRADLDDDGDVDSSDFGLIQRCHSGVNNYAPGCEVANFDNDADVDSDDIGVFLQCLAGANQTPEG